MCLSTDFLHFSGHHPGTVEMKTKNHRCYIQFLLRWLLLLCSSRYRKANRSKYNSNKSYKYKLHTHISTLHAQNACNIWLHYFVGVRGAFSEWAGKVSEIIKWRDWISQFIYQINAHAAHISYHSAARKGTYTFTTKVVCRSSERRETSLMSTSWLHRLPEEFRLVVIYKLKSSSRRLLTTYFLLRCNIPYHPNHFSWRQKKKRLLVVLFVKAFKEIHTIFFSTRLATSVIITFLLMSTPFCFPRQLEL